MAVTVSFRHPKSGDIKKVKVGWSWTLFLFSSAFGVPLFMRTLYLYGAGMAFLSVVVAGASTTEQSTYIFLLFFQLLASIQFGRLGNRLTAVRYLESGYDWAEPDDEATIYAKEVWSLA